MKPVNKTPAPWLQEYVDQVNAHFKKQSSQEKLQQPVQKPQK